MKANPTGFRDKYGEMIHEGDHLDFSKSELRDQIAYDDVFFDSYTHAYCVTHFYDCMPIELDQEMCNEVTIKKPKHDTKTTNQANRNNASTYSTRKAKSKR